MSFSASLVDADRFKDRILSQDDVPDVVCEILEVRTKSDKFGRVLKLPKATVDSVYQQYSDPQDRLFAVLDEFVKQVEPPPTWRVILGALRNPLIGQHRLAQEIESKYCPRVPTDDGSYTYSSQSMHELSVTLLAEPYPVQKSGHTVATTAPVSVESSSTILPGMYCLFGSLMTNETVFIQLEAKSKDFYFQLNMKLFNHDLFQFCFITTPIHHQFLMVLCSNTIALVVRIVYRNSLLIIISSIFTIVLPMQL